MRILSRIYFIAIIVILQACNTTGGLFKKRSPHELYRSKLESSGLEKTVMGAQWIAVAQTSLASPLSVKIPYQEKGYFSPQDIKAVALRFSAKRGEKLNISLTIRPDNFKIYADLLEYTEDRSYKLLAFADTSGSPLIFDADNKTEFILRLQPELLSGGEYSLSINTGPVLAYPVSDPKNKIGSFFGDGRDEGGRLHEGIDMFSAFRTPVVAAANGTVSRVTENTLGGKVVFMRPGNKDYTLYYAHLDSQIVSSGQQVSVGDTLGLMGNTGNARTTPPHLHFGIYTLQGAIDPLPFVDRRIQYPAKISADSTKLAHSLLARKNAVLFQTDRLTGGAALPASTPLVIEGITAALYKVKLPDNSRGFVSARNVMDIPAGEKLNLKDTQSVYDKPDSLAARITTISKGTTVAFIGTFKGFNLVRLREGVVGWIKSD